MTEKKFHNTDTFLPLRLGIYEPWLNHNPYKGIRRMNFKKIRPVQVYRQISFIFISLSG